ncbi:MAG: hypothetical protein F6K24_15870, partial [Okeania sp. SIO2D1]|nr:hypothetical protein [Okeania sp. SIO2D1]
KQDSQYPVYTPNPKSIDHTLIQSLDILVSQYGYVPLAFQAFLKIVGSVNLMGTFPKNIQEKNFPLLDPMVIFPIKEIVDYHQYLIDTSGDICNSSKDEYYIEFSYDEETKEGISGTGVGYGVKLYSKPCIDGTLVNYEDSFGFIDYLRLCFKWGGFPNLQWFESDVNPNFLSFIKELSSTLTNI